MIFQLVCIALFQQLMAAVQQIGGDFPAEFRVVGQQVGIVQLVDVDHKKAPFLC